MTASTYSTRLIRTLEENNTRLKAEQEAQERTLNQQQIELSIAARTIHSLRGSVAELTRRLESQEEALRMRNSQIALLERQIAEITSEVDALMQLLALTSPEEMGPSGCLASAAFGEFHAPLN